MKPYQSFESMEENNLLMPMAGEVCYKCGKCSSHCPSRAITVEETWSIDVGKCVFCLECYNSCKNMILVPAPFYVLKREDLYFKREDFLPDSEEKKTIEFPQLPKEEIKAIGKSIAIRELDTGSCGACESEIAAMDNKYYDVGRFGIKTVPSPRHADVVLVTGPMSNHMKEAAEKTVDAVPDRKYIVACGSCAISGGVFAKGDVVGDGVEDTLPVDIYIPGCPPAPNRIIVSLVKAFNLRH